MLDKQKAIERIAACKILLPKLKNGADFHFIERKELKTLQDLSQLLDEGFSPEILVELEQQSGLGLGEVVWLLGFLVDSNTRHDPKLLEWLLKNKQQ